MTTLAITGGTGFVGRRLIALALERGYIIRALTRRQQPPQPGITWIDGSLDQPDALTRLAGGADAVFHVAGVVNAPSPTGFTRGNVEGTTAMVAAARSADVRRFVHVSSLSAREPQLSNYGRSKKLGEAEVIASDLDWTIVRPPAVYGPGDMDMLDVFRMARMGLALLPPPGRMSVIHADDLARLLLALVETDPGHVILEPDDGIEGGWTHDAFARAIGAAVGQRVLPMALPKAVLALAARVDGLFRKDKARLTQDRVNYMAHPDWVADPARRPGPTLWTAQIPAPQGLADTAAWYRSHNLLR